MLSVSSFLDKRNLDKLKALNNQRVIDIVDKYIKLCKPAKVSVITDSEEDISYIRNLAIRNGEEMELKLKGHTVHYDNYYDQARDKKNTRILLPKGKKISKYVNTIDRDEGLGEINHFLDGSMKGKEMLVCFFCLGPTNSKFSIPALQITDSAYVAHTETLLYRPGYEMFKRLGDDNFFYFIHSAGELDSRNTSKELDKRRIYIDLEDERVLSVNNQYGGNSLGLKKLALRLAISRASKEDWLCEHMFIMGVHPPGKDRVTYFTGAFPSMCGKTSTAMMPGHTVVGDDIAYLRIDDEGYCVAANVEQGIFGVIKDINPTDDPQIYRALTTPRELIFSNVLVSDKVPYWIGMGKKIPDRGINHSGEWYKGKKDKEGNEIPPSSKNARFTLRIRELENADDRIDDPNGVRVSGIIYGGRDSNTSVPVSQSLSWAHGVVIGAALESETTAATLGAEGELKHNPMANMDFLVIPLGVYIDKHLRFGDDLAYPPLIFSTNYFLMENGKYLNEKTDKVVWLLWMEGRVYGEYGAIETPIGYIPRYEDLKNLFRDVLKKDYKVEDYIKQFSIRTEGYLRKIDRIEGIYKGEENVPSVFYRHLEQQRQRLLDAQSKFKKPIISPFDFE